MGNKNSGNRLTSRDCSDFSKLVLKGYNYLLKYFHTFTTAQRIDIAKSIILKAMPQSIEHSGNVGKDTNIIIIKSNGDKIEAGDNNKTVSRALPTV